MKLTNLTKLPKWSTPEITDLKNYSEVQNNFWIVQSHNSDSQA